MRTVVLLGAAIALAIAQPSAEVPRWPGVAIMNPSASGIVVWGLEGADHWLKKPECRALFSEFRDLNGRPLTEKLDELQMEAAAYLRQVRFRDGSTTPQCERELTLMYTSPGSRVVFVCADQLRQRTQSDPVLKSALVLHEVMHTLGLGENPPTSLFITRRVLDRCAR